MSDKLLYSIPHFRLDLRRILMTADEEPDVLTYDSELWGVAYAASKDRLLVITGSKGYLDISYKNLDTLIEELQAMKREMDWKRKR